MVAPVSRQWRFALEVLESPLQPLTWDDVMEAARGAESGTLAAKGEYGDWVDLEFNSTHAAVWYRSVDRVTMRPYFPNRPASAQSIEEFFCNCCGVRLGSLDEFLKRCMLRSEGFRLCRELLRSGCLPALVPEERSDQPILPGMERCVAELAEWRVVEWRIHRPQSGATP